MFCKKCGNRLVAGEKTCRYCGAPAEQAEICGGFWGLVGEEPSPAAVVPPVTPAPPVSPGPDQDPRYRRRLKQLTDRQTLLVVICAVLIVLTLVQAVQIGSLSGRVDALEADVAELETERTADDSSQEKSNGRTDAEQEEAEPKDTEQENDGLSDEDESPDTDGQSAELSVKSSESEDVEFCFSEGGQCRVELPAAEDREEESDIDDRYRFTYAYDGYELEIKNSAETVIVSEDEAEVELTITLGDYAFVQTLEDFVEEWSGGDTEVSLKSETGDVTLVLQKDGNTCELRDNTGATVETWEFIYDPSMGVLSVNGESAERTLRFTFTDEVSDSGTYTFELGDEALDSLLELANAAGEEND